jgi:hypothetical protein
MFLAGQPPQRILSNAGQVKRRKIDLYPTTIAPRRIDIDEIAFYEWGASAIDTT